VVALESTIISHGGLPYPRNLELALDLENAIREEGATPATCAVIDGVAHVGLTRSALEKVANRQDVMKASRRDLAYACAMGKMASTTVAGTMILAHAAGIKFFATGGIGGVHRGAENTFDISADLLELGKTPVVVVSAGVKSILDIPKTLEVLETNGVPVLSLGSDTFPAFFTHGTIPSPRRVDSEADVARMVLAGSHAFGESTPLETGMVVAVPNPMPYPDAQGLEECIKNALTNADKDGIEGAAITPYILGAINELTGGDSLTSNIALVTNNAKVAARIATEHSRLLKSQGSVVSGNGGNRGATGGQKRSYSTSSSVHRRKSVLVVGGSAVDSVSNITTKTTILNSSNPAVTRTSFGG
jgi:pseudouridine-5'-phosphate glycosidase